MHTIPFALCCRPPFFLLSNFAVRRLPTKIKNIILLFLFKIGAAF